MKHPAVYIMASRRNGTLYVGVTSDIAQRAFQHRTGAIEGFTRRYGCKLLVWFEPYERMDEAIAREKQIKSGSRKDKLALIERDNPLWTDLYETLNASFRHREEAEGRRGGPGTAGRRTFPGSLCLRSR